MSVIRGTVFDVVVDIRRGSPNFGAWVSVTLSEGKTTANSGFRPVLAHGFCVTSEVADFFYKCTEFYSPQCERALRWDDPTLSIRWPANVPIVSAKDLAAPLLSDMPVVPDYRP